MTFVKLRNSLQITLSTDRETRVSVVDVYEDGATVEVETGEEQDVLSGRH
jgi:hypothetical protein